MAMSDEQIAAFHERFAAKFKTEDEYRDQMRVALEEQRAQYLEALNLLRLLAQDLGVKYSSGYWDSDELDALCPHCKEPLLK